MFFHGPRHLPNSIEGYERVESAAVTQFEDQVDSAYKNVGLKAVSGAYRQSNQAFILTLAVDPPAAFPSVPELFNSIADAMRNGGPVSPVFGGLQTTSGANELTQQCAPLQGAPATGSLCVWTDTKTVGVFLGVRIDVQEAQQITAETRRVMEG